MKIFKVKNAGKVVLGFTLLFVFSGCAGNGKVNINSVPWGTVSIDGKPVGVTPLIDHKLSAGKHSLEIKKKNYKNTTKDIMIIKDKTSTFNINLAVGEGGFKFVWLKGSAASMQNKGVFYLIIGPEINNKEHYSDMREYIQNIATNRSDTIALYSYKEKDSINDTLYNFETEIRKLKKFYKDLKISYFVRYMDEEQTQKFQQRFASLNEFVSYAGEIIIEDY